MDKKERFISLCSTVEREGMDELIRWLEETTDFYDSPASTKFHRAYSGGLLEHSLNVYDEMKRLLAIYPEIQASDDSVIISSLFHDLCKANFYIAERRNRKNAQGQWESYDAFTVKEQFCFGGHGSKSVFLVQHFIKLTPEEAVAINCHMSAFCNDWKNVGSAYEQFPFAWLLHVADESATYIKEKENN